VEWLGWHFDDAGMNMNAAYKACFLCRQASGLAALVCLFSCLWAAGVEGQFLSRDYRRLWNNEVFENYGAGSYRDYDFSEENRRFDFFGDILIDGVDVVEYSEIRRDALGVPGSYEGRNARYDRFFDKLVIANEGFGPWSTRLIIGDHIRTFFTPMTLNLPNFNGIRWDGSSKKSRFSIIATQLTDPVRVPGGAEVDQTFEERRVFGTTLVGGHWENQIGDILKLGTSYVNTHRFDAEASANVNTLKGTVPQVMHGGLRQVYVFFSDDDPQDTNPGALIGELVLQADGREILPVRVGRIESLLDHIPITPDLTSSVVIDPNEVTYLRKNKSWLKSVIENSNRPFFATIIDGAATPVSPARNRSPLNADDFDVVFYEFALPDTTNELVFEAVVGNDYSVDVVGAMQIPLLASGADNLYYDWFNALRAEGRPRDGDNLHRVRFRYGLPTGLSILGFNFDADIWGIKAQGEFAHSRRFFQVPQRRGKRSVRSVSTYYMQMRRPVHDRAEAGFEWFNVPHDYSTNFSLFQQSRVGPTVGGRLYRDFDVVTDNDDLDEWPDQLEHNDPLAPFATSLSGVGNGVFPGLDPDNDGTLDFNVDGANGTDAFQPFLGYYAEPSDLVYGDDFDNNGLVDFRENDNLPDYTYPGDSRGLHAFLTTKPIARLEIRLGLYRMAQEALGGNNNTRYVESQYQRHWEGLGYFRLNHRIKWVEDDINNTVYSSTVRSGEALPRIYDLDTDRLENRNSVNQLTYFETGMQTVPNLNIRHIISYNRINLEDQVLPDPLFARPGAIAHFSMVNKIDYVWEQGRLRLMPQFKHIYQRSKFPEREIPDRQRRWIMPIVRADFRLGPRTVLKTGIQGLPLIPETSVDQSNPAADFRRRTYTGFIENRSNYRGYDLSILMGIFRTRTSYTGSSRPPVGFLEYFFRVYIG
jgi:hypothetical protein